MIVEVKIGFEEETLEKIDRLHTLLGGDNKTNTLVKAVILALDQAELLMGGGTIVKTYPDGRVSEMRIDASTMRTEE